MTKSILNELGYSEVSCDWVKLASDAYEACHYNANESFREDLSVIAPDIEPLEEYKGTNIPILVRNKNVGIPPGWQGLIRF